VSVHPFVCSPDLRQKLVDRLLLFYTGMRREAGTILGEARQRLEARADSRAVVDGLVAVAASLREAILAGHVDRVGALLDESWRLKKQMASNVSNGHLDAIYRAALEAGAVGGKIAGAGGGGCLLLFAPRKRHDAVRAAMAAAGLREIPFAIEPEGSRIIHYSQDRQELVQRSPSRALKVSAARAGVMARLHAARTAGGAAVPAVGPGAGVPTAGTRGGATAASNAVRPQQARRATGPGTIS